MGNVIYSGKHRFANQNKRTAEAITSKTVIAGMALSPEEIAYLRNLEKKEAANDKRRS